MEENDTNLSLCSQNKDNNVIDKKKEKRRSLKIISDYKRFIYIIICIIMS